MDQDYKQPGIKIEGFFSSLRECCGQGILKCSDQFKQDIFLFGFQFDPKPDNEKKKIFLILFESERKRNKFFHQSNWLGEVKLASKENRIVIQKVSVDLSKVCILQYNELNFYPPWMYEKVTFDPLVVEIFSKASSFKFKFIENYIQTSSESCSSRNSWEICMEHISAMELLAKIAERRIFSDHDQNLFHLSISHTRKCHSNVSKLAQVAILMNFPGVNMWRNEIQRKNDYLEASRILEWLHDQNYWMWNEGTFLAYHLQEMAQQLYFVDIFEAGRILKKATDIFSNLTSKTEHAERMSKSCNLFSAWINKTCKSHEDPVLGEIKAVINEREMVISQSGSNERIKVDLNTVNVYLSKTQERVLSLLDIDHLQQLVTITFSSSVNTASSQRIASIHILDGLHDSMDALETIQKLSIFSEEELSSSSEEEQFLTKVSNNIIKEVEDDTENDVDVSKEDLDDSKTSNYKQIVDIEDEDDLVLDEKSQNKNVVRLNDFMQINKNLVERVKEQEDNLLLKNDQLKLSARELSEKEKKIKELENRILKYEMKMLNLETELALETLKTMKKDSKVKDLEDYILVLKGHRANRK